MSSHIVTDSGACFDERWLQHYSAYLTILPYRISVGDKSFTEQIDVEATTLLSYFREATTPVVAAPTVDDYTQYLTRLAHQHQSIVVITTSSQLSDSYDHARLAATQVGKADQIHVVDSLNVGVGHGLLVKAAIKQVQNQTPVSSVVQQIRDMRESIYSIYLVDSPRAMYRSGMLEEAHTILADMLRIMPLVQLEEGDLAIQEKVRSRSQAVDSMVEFLTEFEDVDDAAIIQNSVHINEDIRQLQDRLSAQFPGRHFPYTPYSAIVASYLGGNAIGVAVLENEFGENDDD